MFKFLYNTYIESPAPCSSCENCGHEIRDLYYLSNTDNNKVMVVGSECFKHLLAPNEVVNAEKARKRMERAKRQYRENKPQRKENETKSEYISRRLCEMQNAMIAYKGYAAAFVKISLYEMARRRLMESLPSPRETRFERIFRHQTSYTLDIMNTEHGHSGSIHSCETCKRIAELNAAWEKLRQEEERLIMREFEVKYQANLFDFYRPIWEVRKI
jgi:hypothetical protein